MHDEEFLDLFKPKDQTDTPADGSTELAEVGSDLGQPPERVEGAPPERVEGAPPEPVAGESPELVAGEPEEAVGGLGATQSVRPVSGYTPPPDAGPKDRPGVADTPVQQDHSWGMGDEAEVASRSATVSGPGCTLRTIGLLVGGGCLLLVLSAVVVFAFIQVFLRRGGDDEAQGTPTLTESVAFTPVPTAPVAESPLIVPLISSDDVRVPVALPEYLAVGQTAFTVQTVDTPAGVWPDVPTAGDVATWAYGTVINYILRLAPTPENRDLLSALQVGDPLSLHMSTGLVLNFDVDEVITGATDETVFFEQLSPRLTIALLADDGSAEPTGAPVQHIVVMAAFFDDGVADEDLLAGATAGVVGTPVDQGPVRVTVIEAYQVTAGEAGLPDGMGYLLIDFAVENVGTAVLEMEFLQTFVSNAAGGRYPLTIAAGQFAHYGLPTEPLAPGETVIGSAGYMVPVNPEGQVRWAFNPLPGSDNWVVVPVSYELPAPTPTPEPPSPVGFARVTVDPDDVFIDRGDDLLIIGLEIENISAGVVQVTEDDISLTSRDGEFFLETAAPLLPWVIEPGEFKQFELQFELPSTDDALLDVLGYTFSVDNIGGE